MVKPDNDERKLAMFRDNKLRLLMKLAGFERIGEDDEPDAPWVIPSNLTSARLQETLNIIEKHRKDPVMQYGEDGFILAEDMLRRKANIRPRAVFDDDSEGDDLDTLGEDEVLFPVGGPTVRKSDALAELKRKRRKRRIDTASGGESDDEALRAKRKARASAELEKRRKLKSDVLIHSSDEEDDEERDREFFAREDEIRKGQSLKVLQALKAARENKDLDIGRKRKRGTVDDAEKKKVRLSGTDTESADEDLPMGEAENSSSPAGQQLRTSDNEASETPLSSPQNNPLKEIDVNRTQSEHGRESFSNSKISQLALDGDDEDEDDMPLPKTTQNRRMRDRAAVLEDSDDD